MDKYDNAFKALINKQLEKHNVDFDYVMEHPEIDGKLWCTYYTTTPRESIEFRKWAIDFLRMELKWTKKRSEREFPYFDLMYGLRVSPEATTAP